MLARETLICVTSGGGYMPTEKKEKTVTILEDLLLKSEILVATDYRGLSVAEITQLRRKLAESNIEYHVVKNTLARLAARRTGREELVGLLDGPTAIAFAHGDASEPAKVLQDYIRSSKLELGIKGGLLGEQLLTSDGVLALSRLPPREVLLARFVGGLQMPIMSLLNVLNANTTGLVRLLRARIQELEE